VQTQAVARETKPTRKCRESVRGHLERTGEMGRSWSHQLRSADSSVAPETRNVVGAAFQLSADDSWRVLVDVDTTHKAELLQDLPQLVQ